MQKFVVLVLLLGAVGACTRPNPNVCCATDEQCAEIGVDELRPCGVGQACAPDRTCVAAECTVTADCTSPEAPICSNGLCIGTCTSADDCAPVNGRPYCAADSTCVGCIDGSQCAAATPVCDTDDRACRGCERDDECPSGVCIEADGVCADESRIIYVTMFGSDGECTRTSPCESFAHALGKVRYRTRDVIHLFGGRIDLGAQVSMISLPVIIDGTNTTLTASGSPGFFALVAGGELTLEGVSFSTPVENSITIAGSASLRIYNSTVLDAGYNSIVVSGGSLMARSVRFEGTPSSGPEVVCEAGSHLRVETCEIRDFAFSATNSLVTVSGSRFSNRTGSMLGASGGTATVTNNLFIQDYELADSVHLSVGSGSLFAFNTIVNNSSLVSDGVALYCSTSLEITSNIFAYNSTNPINGAACAVRNSLFDLPGAVDASSNATADARTFFVDPASGNYAPGISSPARDGGEPGLVTTDLEGNPRGATPDIGALEAP